MFESAEIGHKVDKATHEKELPVLREALLDAQYDLISARAFPVVIIVSGVDGAGRSESVQLLNAWLDPRHIETHGMGEPSDEERDRPPMWRFWRALPGKGKVGVFQGSWYSMPIIDRVYGKTGNDALEEAMERNIRFERMLADEGALILKFWFHLSREGQKKRLRKLEKDPRTRWRVTERDWHHYGLYDTFARVCAHALRMTSSAHAPWHIIEGEDARYRELAFGRILLEALRQRLDAKKPGKPATTPSVPVSVKVDDLNILKALDMGSTLAKQDYEEQLETLQGRLNLLTRHKRFGDISVACVFEGNDAAGKGGSIRRITGALDARHYQVIPIAAPSDEEKAQPYLWRFWRHIPRRGRLALFDRSWYGRVLVERVEGFCGEHDWRRAYSEINDFEAQLAEHRIVVVKFWLAISQEEQLKRFKEREATGFKRFKITPEDWRNRDKWDAYEQAVCDMVDQTSTEIAPWTLVPANDKYSARIRILKTLCERIETEIKRARKGRS
ncbi:MAG: polyphosphate:AMP phosphotransferase [Pseudomonadota bacterium]